MQAIGRRERLRIELDAGVLEARVYVGEFLQQVVVRGRDHARTRIGERFEAGLRQRRTFARVGADADFVEHRERALVRLCDDPRELRDVRGKRREVLVQILRVADRGDDVIHRRDARAFRRGHEQTRARRERRQRERLHRDRLAARVRAADHEHVKALAEPHVVRDDFMRGQQRVP